MSAAFVMTGSVLNVSINVLEITKAYLQTYVLFWYCYYQEI